MADPLRAVILDIDGTLIDSVDAHAHAWQEVFEKFGVPVSFGDVRQQIGKGSDQLMPVFLSPALIRAKGKIIERECQEIFKEKYLPHIRAFPEVRALFERIRAEGLKAALASSAKGEELRDYVKIADIEGLFTETTTSDDAERSKPHPDIFQATLEKLGVSAGEAVAVGDTPHDVQAARKLGLLIVGVLCGGFPEAELRAAGCVAIYRDPADLLARFEESPLNPHARA